MGIHGLSKVIGDHAPSASKENEIKNYFGKYQLAKLKIHIREELVMVVDKAQVNAVYCSHLL